MKPSNNSAPPQTERELFASMAKVRQPLAPDSPQTQPESATSLDIGHADAIRARLKARFPSLTDEELDSEMF